ncbi:FAD-binding oxidoreductase [Parasedimentitalea psychrophila]|uniref:FAD-binding oxidoreductase n=1 Tax=Parasedimentitalea psychrophila TaxID=2997337 RepID=A0A9Y2P4I2_9RHOB|nr:FAD-binding oxidoreductase [Parasedimentitalea psychrophila]WIY25349.1 FAD-binding oxidoreductase [Parasedimentitalea psychrophila]
MKRIARRAFLLGSGGAAGWIAANQFSVKQPVFDGVKRIIPSSGGGILNDASGLSATPVHKHIVISEDPGEALIQVVRNEMRAAKADGRPFNIGAARHSMGGQAIPRNGIAMTFENSMIEPDTDAGVYRVHAGARWSQVISALDLIGFSPKVMQSNNDFGVAATYSVNAHGWPVPYGPMGSTVRSLNMILPSGELVTCSRKENSELFGHAMGGYGLIGAIVDLEVEMENNTRLFPLYEVMPADEFSRAYQTALMDPEVTMAYGRLNVERAAFFEEALLVTYRKTTEQENLPPVGGSGWMSVLASRIYRAQLGSEPMKDFRWWNETVIGPTLGGGDVTRNGLMNEPVKTLDDRNPDRVDILHEYFVDFDRFNEFLTVCREVIPASYQEFLNVTLRYVAADAESTLSYAPKPRIAAVMSFSQELAERAEADMARMTEILIDRIVAIGGAFYLPYRPHARVDQLVAAYPQVPAFVDAKRRIDPDLILRNNFWDTYLRTL